MQLTPEKLKSIFSTLSRTKCAQYAPLISDALQEFAIINRKRACAFLAQIGHESADLKYMQEIASGAAYEGRRDLGNTQPGDGRRFKGRGPLQITGRDNYRKAGDALQLDLITRPELLEYPRHGFRASAWWWREHGLNQKADALALTGTVSDLKQFDRITRTINGGYNGQVDRQRRYLDCIEVLTDEDFAVPAGRLPGDEVHPAPPGQNKLLDRLRGNEDVQKIGRSAGRKAANRLGTPIGTLFAALEAGNWKAWAALAVVAVGLTIFIYEERRAIVRLWKRVTS